MNAAFETYVFHANDVNTAKLSFMTEPKHVGVVSYDKINIITIESIIWKSKTLVGQFHYTQRNVL